MQQPATDDRAPQFLFISRLSEEQLEKASVEAFARARKNAERLARAAGLRLGGLGTLHFGHGGVHDSRAERMMDRQRCAAVLAGTSYDVAEHELVSDDPRPAEFAIQVNAHFAVE
jgi:uncharacterized protein YggE